MVKKASREVTRRRAFLRERTVLMRNGFKGPRAPMHWDPANRRCWFYHKDGIGVIIDAEDVWLKNANFEERRGFDPKKIGLFGCKRIYGSDADKILNYSR